jgi:hypothetical protein
MLIIYYMFRAFGHHQLCTFTAGSLLTWASVYREYIFCCGFDILGCNATLYVFVKMFNLKIINV